MIMGEVPGPKTSLVHYPSDNWLHLNNSNNDYDTFVAD